MTNSTFASLFHDLRRLADNGDDPRQTDRELLTRLLTDRDEAAFALLVRRHGRLVLSACRRVLTDAADVEDAFQATFLVLLRRASSVRWQPSIGSWLFGVAHRIAVRARADALRRRQREANTSRRRDITAPPDLSWREGVGLLHEELDRLPERYRLPLLLCYLDGKTRDEAARMLGCSLGALHGRLERGRDRLRVRLQRRGLTLSAALLAALVDTLPALSAVPSPLVRATLQAARTGEYGGSLAALVRVGTPVLFGGKLRFAAGLLLTVGVLAVGGVHSLASRQAAPAAETPAAVRADSPHAKSTPDKLAPKAAASVTFRGRVLGPDGKPVQGTRFYSARLARFWPRRDGIVTLAQKDPTGADGRFDITLDRPEPEEYAYLIAHADGYGVDWLDRNEEGRPGEVVFRLPKDVPITGRVVNTEGRPVAGVSVSAAATYVPLNENLDDYLKGWLRDLRDNLATPQKRLYVSLDGITGRVATDKDGRFTLHGAGGERIIHVTFSGGGVARSMPYVITRPGFDATPYNDVIREKHHENLQVLNPFPGPRPPSFTFIVTPGKTIEGTVKDAASGKPLPGCRLRALTGFGDAATAVSDATGKYHLDGLPKKARGYSVFVRPPQGSVYLSRSVNAADTGGLATIRLDVKLVKGSIVTGRVVDRQTGKIVPCGIQLLPLQDNAFLNSPKYGREQAEGSNNPDGSFRGVTMPGKMLVLARVLEQVKFQGNSLCAYRGAIPDPDHKDLFHWDGDFWFVKTAQDLAILSGENGVKVIDVKENGENRVELVVDRGATSRIAIQDAEGKPLAGAWAAGLTDIWPTTYQLSEATATVYALNPDKPRTMAFYHAEKKLGGTATVRGDEKEPVIVKLAPVGSVSGRLLDAEGNILEGVEVSINPEGQIGRALYRFAFPTGKPIHTDKEGRFRLEGVVPGVKFRLNLRQERGFLVGEPRIGVRQVEPEKLLNFGDIRTKPQR